MFGIESTSYFVDFLNSSISFWMCNVGFRQSQLSKCVLCHSARCWRDGSLGIGCCWCHALFILIYLLTCCDLLVRYLPATLTAKEGKIKNTVIKSSFCNKVFTSLLPSFPSGAVKTILMPKIPNTIEEPINIPVAIFCMPPV